MSAPESSLKSSDEGMTLKEYISAYGDSIGVPKPLRDAIFTNESNFEHYDGAGNVKQGPMTRYGWRATGIGQLSPDTAKKWKVDASDPIQNLRRTERTKELYDKYLQITPDPYGGAP